MNRKTNEAVIEKKSKKRQLKKDSDFASPKKVQPDNKVIYDKYIVYDKKRFDEKQELQVSPLLRNERIAATRNRGRCAGSGVVESEELSGLGS